MRNMLDLVNAEEVKALEEAMALKERSGPMGSVSKKSKVTSAFVTLALMIMEEGFNFDDVISKGMQKELIDYLGSAQKQEA